VGRQDKKVFKRGRIFVRGAALAPRKSGLGHCPKKKSRKCNKGGGEVTQEGRERKGSSRKENEESKAWTTAGWRSKLKRREGGTRKKNSFRAPNRNVYALGTNHGKVCKREGVVKGHKRRNRGRRYTRSRSVTPFGQVEKEYLSIPGGDKRKR